MNSLSQAKATLRKQARQIYLDLDPQKIVEAGVLVAGHVKKWLNFMCSQHVLKHVALFANFKDEIPTGPLAALLQDLGFILSWPSMVNNLITFEPAHQADIIFVPGLAFDCTGHRLGRGEGHYDRYLSGLDHQMPRPILIGLCFDEQLVKTVPIEKHDITMDFVCTPTLGMHKVSGE